MNNRSAAAIRNNFIASGLTQEGIEIVRNFRDNDWLASPSRPFGTSIPDGDWRAQWDSQALIALGSNPNLTKDPVSGVFSYDFGDETIFKRAINISTTLENPSSVEKRIVVNVTWIERGGSSKFINAEDHLFNWK